MLLDGRKVPWYFQVLYMVYCLAGVLVSLYSPFWMPDPDFRIIRGPKICFLKTASSPGLPKFIFIRNASVMRLVLQQKTSGYWNSLIIYHQSQGYHWYHIFPDFIFKKPWIIFSRRYWRKTLFEPQYISIHFLW